MVYTWPTIKEVKGENPWVTYVKRQVLKRNNCINSIWTGIPGSGKSWGLLSLFTLIDPDFELEGNFFFKASKLMKAIKDGNYPSGKLWGYDEAGIDLNNLKYYNQINQGLNAFLQTARHKNYVFGFTVPYMSLVSKGVRMLMNAEFKCNSYNKQNQTKIMPRVMEYNGEYDKYYRKRLLVKRTSGFEYCTQILLPMPPKHIITEYEKRKKEFTADLFSTIAEKMEAQELKDKGEARTGVVTERQDQVLKMLKKGLNTKAIAGELKCHINNVNGIIRSLRRKSVIIQPVKRSDGTYYYRIEDNRPDFLKKPEI